MKRKVASSSVAKITALIISTYCGRLDWIRNPPIIAFAHGDALFFLSVACFCCCELSVNEYTDLPFVGHSYGLEIRRS